MTAAALIDPSSDALLCRRLVDRFGQAGAHSVVDQLVANLTNVELAALAAHWPFWARPKQLPPAAEWRSFGCLAARGWGKSETIARYLIGEMQTRRVMFAAGAAQNERKTIDAQVLPLIRCSPPNFRPEWEANAMRLTWPNGARYLAFTPEAPDPIRSENHDLVWMSEIQSWPTTTRDEAWKNFVFACRIGLARRMWDATPKRGHPILKKLLARAEKDPTHHIVRRGTMYENPHLTAAAVQELEAEYGGTTAGREELLGEMLDESDANLVKQVWIDRARRERPDRIRRRVIGVDPALSVSGRSDRTGIVDVGLGFDDQLYVLADLTDKYQPEEWAKVVIDRYLSERCGLVTVERNAGGDYVLSNLRSYVDRKRLQIVKLGDDEPVGEHRPDVVFVREVFSRRQKQERAQPIATRYERGGISHVIGVDLAELEEWLTTWEPAPRSESPDAIDALVIACTDLLGLVSKATDHSVGFVGIEAVARQVTAATSPSDARSMVSQLLRGSGGGWGGGRI